MTISNPKVSMDTKESERNFSDGKEEPHEIAKIHHRWKALPKYLRSICQCDHGNSEKILKMTEIFNNRREKMLNSKYLDSCHKVKVLVMVTVKLTATLLMGTMKRIAITTIIRNRKMDTMNFHEIILILKSAIQNCLGNV